MDVVKKFCGKYMDDINRYLLFDIYNLRLSYFSTSSYVHIDTVYN